MRSPLGAETITTRSIAPMSTPISRLVEQTTARSSPFLSRSSTSRRTSRSSEEWCTSTCPASFGQGGLEAKAELLRTGAGVGEDQHRTARAHQRGEFAQDAADALAAAAGKDAGAKARTPRRSPAAVCAPRRSRRADPRREERRHGFQRADCCRQARRGTVRGASAVLNARWRVVGCRLRVAGCGLWVVGCGTSRCGSWSCC